MQQDHITREECTAAWYRVFDVFEVNPNSFEEFAKKHNSDVVPRGMSVAQLQRYIGTGGKGLGVPQKDVRVYMAKAFKGAVADYPEDEQGDLSSAITDAVQKSKAFWAAPRRVRSAIANSSSDAGLSSHSQSTPLEPTVLKVIAAEAQSLQRQLMHALEPDSWTSVEGSTAWGYAMNKLREVETRHAYMELMSLIEPAQWKTGKWEDYHSEIVERSWAASPDAVRRLHILNGRMLPLELQRGKGFGQQLRSWCLARDRSGYKEESIRQIRALVLAEYLCGIRARVLFFCEEQLNDPLWPSLQPGFLLDAGTYYQTTKSGPGYKVILSNLKPLQKSYPEDDLVVYKFHHDEATERLYWLLRANYFRLLRGKSQQLFNVFELFTDHRSLSDQVSWSDVEAFLPTRLRTVLNNEMGGSLPTFVEDSFRNALPHDLAKEYEFERLLKERIRPLRPSI